MTLELSTGQRAQLWRAGQLFYKLHSSQLEVYQHYQAWSTDCFEKRKAGVALPGAFPRCYVVDSSRRWGKDLLCMCLLLEKAIRRPKSVLSYATSYARDINEIVLPLFTMLTEDCPASMLPVYRTHHQGTSNGLYFANGSVIKLIGIDARVDSLRGRFSDGYVFSEAAFIDKLSEAIVRICMPQLQGRQHADILINSTPPVNPATWYDTDLCPDAVARGAYSNRTILQNPLLSKAEVDEFIRAAGGLESENCQREYFTKRIRSATASVVPEFSRARNVVAMDRPEYAKGWVVLDPGTRDLCAISAGWYDFSRDVLVIRNAWQRRNANTAEVVDAVKEIEAKTFGASLQYWDNKGFHQNPAQRFSDTEARLILDMKSLYGVQVVPVDKSEGKEAALQRLRTAVQTQRIEWHPDAEDSIAAVEAAVFNKARDGWQRSEKHGHYDNLDVAIYANLMCRFKDCPDPPRGVVLSQSYTPDQLMLPKHSLERKRSISEKWAKVFGNRKFQTNGRR